VAETFTGRNGKFVPLAQTVKAFKEMVQGHLDHLPEQAFYMVGGLEDALAQAEKMGVEVGARG